jgi:endonuclease YncB( thermonuclease family)
MPGRVARLLMTAVLGGAAMAADTAFTGAVVAIGDGGAITVAGADGARAVVPAGIAVPLRDQPCGRDACGLIFAATFQREVLVRPLGAASRHGALSARIRLADGSDLGEQLVWAGLARCAADAAACDPLLLADQDQARREGRGVWRPDSVLAAVTPTAPAVAVAPVVDTPMAPAPSRPVTGPTRRAADPPALAVVLAAPSAPGPAVTAAVAAVVPMPAPAAAVPAASVAAASESSSPPAATPGLHPAATPAAREQAGADLDRESMMDVDHLAGHVDP